MKRILIPTDFSACANKAVDYAVCLALKSGAEIKLLHACELIHNPFQDQKDYIEAENHSIETSRSAQLESLKKCIEETEPVKVSTQLYDGGVIESVLEESNVYHPDLIIMGSMGRTGLRNKIMGSKTAALLSKSSVPVLMIPSAYEWTEPKQVLLAVNDPNEDLDQLRLAFDIGALFNATINAAIFSRIHEPAIEVMEHSRSIYSIQQELQKTHANTFVTAVHLSGREFEDALQEYITANNIDLLAMITHKRTTVQKLFQRSMTRKMNYHTTIPLLSIRV